MGDSAPLPLDPLATSTISDFNGLLPLLQRLDQLLDYAIAAAEMAYGNGTPATTHEHSSRNAESVERLLSREPGSPAFQGYQTVNEIVSPIILQPGSRLDELQRTFALSNFDLDIVAIALAPELDRRYERIYAYLQEHAHCQRPTVDLALNLLCTSAADKLVQRLHFAPEAPLLRHEVLHLIPNPQQSRTTLLAHELHLDQQIVRFLLAQPGLDTQLQPTCQLIQPLQSPAIAPHLSLNPEQQQVLSNLLIHHQTTHQPLRLYFQGSDRQGKRRLAEALAAIAHRPLLIIDLARLLEDKSSFSMILKRSIREAQLQAAWIYFDEFDPLNPQDHPLLYQHLWQAIAQHLGITFLSGTQPYTPSANGAIGMITIPIALPDVAQRRVCWQHHLTQRNISLDKADLNVLSDRFQLTPDQIADAVAIAHNTNLWRTLPTSPSPLPTPPSLPLPSPHLPHLFAAARTQSGHALAALAHKIEARYTWDDIVLPDDQKAELQDICNQAKYRYLVQEEWGFNQKLSLGQGLTVLFAGQPGTGKTMAAEVIAHALQLDLYKIDLSQVVSKYIGETEKNLNRIFTAATHANAILLFDEADALFGKRSEVKDAHDRYANIETSYLLQKMEEYDGVAILTTNLQSNMDEAFIRRLRFIIEFALPGIKERLRIWQQIFPPQVPRSKDIDFDFLAQRFEIPGAVIRNIALRAAYLAAAEGDVVQMKYLIQAVRQEYQKMGKILMAEAFEM
jgi:AAA+ superfamily predicted ATPase